MNAADAPSSPPPPRVAERLLIDGWPTLIGPMSPRRVLCTSLGRAQLARVAAERHAEAAVDCYFLDRYQATLAEHSDGQRPSNVTIRCEADFAGEASLDVAAIPISSQGEAELVREQLQQAYDLLSADGLLLTATDNPRDVWLAEVTAELGGTVRRIPRDDGVVYVVRKTVPLRRRRDFTGRFAFRHQGRLFQALSRPGVFSHRRMDPGARRLLDAMEVADGMRVLDIGCGWGPVALAAAAAGENVICEAIDSNARAVACTRANAAANGLSGRVQARLEAAGRTTSPGSFDVAFGNPPYFGNFRIAALFVDAAFNALRPGGQLVFVTKSPEWYVDALPGRFRSVEILEIKGYHVVKARRI